MAKDNQYISRYNGGETRFPRVDPTPWTGIEEDAPPLWGQWLWGAGIGAVLVLLFIIPILWLE